MSDEAVAPADPGPRDLWSWVEWRARRSPARTLAFDEHDRSVDFDTFHRRSERVAAGLLEAGVAPGTRVAWIQPTRIEALLLAAALARLGCEQVPLMPVLGARELGFVLDQARPACVLVGPPGRGVDHAEIVRERLGGSPDALGGSPNSAGAGAGAIVLVLGAELPEADPAGLPAYAVPSDDPVRWIFYTSGTTSEPKGVLHSDGTLIGSAIGLEAPHRFVPDDRVSLVFPYAHVGGPTLLLSALRIGHALILSERFDPDDVSRTLSRHGVTLAGSGPAFWQAFIAAQRGSPERRLFPMLRALIGGGAAKPAHLHAEAWAVLGVPILSGYGSTECPGLAYNRIGDPDALLASDGRPVEGVEIRIVRPDGSLADVDEEGEIRVRGPMLFRGYLGQDASPLDADGFFPSGDLGRLGAEGELVVTGRIKDVIIRKGENISAKEIEDVLGGHPAVADVAVVGLPDAARGERCCAVVVARPGAPAPSLGDLTSWCEDAGLTKLKHPEQLELVEALPRNETGKVLKTALRSRFGPSGDEHATVS